MKRTQIQLPDWLFAAARDVAARKEVSLAELVRRGLEYMVAVTPVPEEEGSSWQLPEAHALGGLDDWESVVSRETLHTGRLRVAEDKASYGGDT